MSEIEKVAKIARIKLEEKEKKGFEKDLKDILSYFSSIESLKSDDETRYVTERRNTFRKDKAEDAEPECILDNAPVKEGKLFRVPKNL